MKSTWHRPQRQILTPTALRRGAQCIAASVCIAASAPAAADPRTHACLADLARVLEAEGYTADIAQGAVPGPSIVDAVDAIAAASDADVVVRVDGDRAHAVAPFLSHRRVRAIVAQAADDERGCAIATHVAAASQRRAMLRWWFGALALIGAVSAVSFGRRVGALRTRSTGRGSSRSAGSPGRT